ncbi:hypothetical protein LCGC14_1477140 [marine sediment metagenome]|uniref:Uncharacterized protein n=1 Tax=marine sediment metagenome TaxID=412755 RepID=A0A0F9JWN8_9ZZZZ
MNSNDRVKRYRERQKALQGVTSPLVETVTQKGALHPKALQKDTVTLYRYIDGKHIELAEVPEGYKVLSDGQVWRPQEKIPVKGNDRISFIQRELNNPYLVGSIDNAGRVLGDRLARYEKAYRYKLWKDGKPVDELDSGSAAKLFQVCTSLNKHDVAHLVRYGVSGPTMDIVSETLGAS